MNVETDVLWPQKHLAPRREWWKGGLSHKHRDTRTQPAPPARQCPAGANQPAEPGCRGRWQGWDGEGHPSCPASVPQSPAQAEPYLEEGSVLLPVVVLLAGVLPGDAEDALLVVLPHQPGVLAAVYLVDQPLPEFPIAAAHRVHPALARLQVHATRVRGWAGGFGVPHQAELSTGVQAPALWEAVEGGKWAGCGERQTHRSSAGLSLHQSCPAPDVTHTTPNSSHGTQGGPGKHGTEPQEIGLSPPQPSPGTACAADFDRLPPVPIPFCMNRHWLLKLLL